MIRPQESIEAFKGIPIPFMTQILVLCFWLVGQKKFDQPQYKAILFMSLIIFVSTSFVSVSMSIEIIKEFFTITALIFIILANSVTTLSRQQAICFVYIIAAVVMSLHGIDMSMDPERTGWTGQDMLFRADKGDIWQVRYIGIFGDPNDMGMVLGSSLFLCIYFILASQSSIKKLFYLTLGGTILYGIYLCQSRGTFLAVVAAIGLYGAFRYNLMKLALPAMIIAPIALMVLPDNLLGGSGDESSQDRIYAWYDGILMLKSSPLIGVGTDQFADLHGGLTAHNSWVLAFAEMGFLGFWCWMTIIVTSAYTAHFYGFKSFQPVLDAEGELSEAERNQQLMAKCIFFALIVALICAFFISRTYNIILYVLCALSMSAYNVSKESDRQLSPPSIQKYVFMISLAVPLVINVIVIVKT